MDFFVGLSFLSIQNSLQVTKGQQYKTNLNQSNSTFIKQHQTDMYNFDDMDYQRTKKWKAEGETQQSPFAFAVIFSYRTIYLPNLSHSNLNIAGRLYQMSRVGLSFTAVQCKQSTPTDKAQFLQFI